MMILTGALVLAIFTFTISPWLTLSVCAVWLVSITRNLMNPLYSAWVIQRLDSDSRATVISMSGQVDTIGQVASGPFAGMVNIRLIKATIIFASLLISPALPLIARSNRKKFQSDLPGRQLPSKYKLNPVYYQPRLRMTNRYYVTMVIVL